MNPMKEKPSERLLWLSLGIETTLGLLACSAIFMSSIYWSLMVGFAATLALIVFIMDSQDASNEWGRQLHIRMIFTLAERLDNANSSTDQETTSERISIGIHRQISEIMSDGGVAEWRIIAYQLRCGSWIAGGATIAYLVGPTIRQAFP